MQWIPPEMPCRRVLDRRVRWAPGAGSDTCHTSTRPLRISGPWGLGHSGWGGGFRSLMAINLVNGDVVVVLTNNDALAPEAMLWGVALSS
jgi:CubicO group peptidase (beta-lactamase class C family)